MKTKIEVEITNIEIDDRYYSFNYEIFINGRLIGSGQYESDHAWVDDKSGFRKLLESGEAVNRALEQELF